VHRDQTMRSASRRPDLAAPDRRARRADPADQGQRIALAAYGEIVDALPMPTAVLSTAGLVVAATPPSSSACSARAPRSSASHCSRGSAAPASAPRSAAPSSACARAPGHHSFSARARWLAARPARPLPRPRLQARRRPRARHLRPRRGERPRDGDRPRPRPRPRRPRPRPAPDRRPGLVVHANPAARDLFGSRCRSLIRRRPSPGTGSLLGRSLLERADPEGARTLSQGMTRPAPATGAASSTSAASTASRSPSSSPWPPAAARARP
jgi:hypothetical protein